MFVSCQSNARGNEGRLAYGEEEKQGSKRAVSTDGEGQSNRNVEAKRVSRESASASFGTAVAKGAEQPTVSDDHEERDKNPILEVLDKAMAGLCPKPATAEDIAELDEFSEHTKASYSETDKEDGMDETIASNQEDSSGADDDSDFVASSDEEEEPERVYNSDLEIVQAQETVPPNAVRACRSRREANGKLLLSANKHCKQIERHGNLTYSLPSSFFQRKLATGTEQSGAVAEPEPDPDREPDPDNNNDLVSETSDRIITLLKSAVEAGGDQVTGRIICRLFGAELREYNLDIVVSSGKDSVVVEYLGRTE